MRASYGLDWESLFDVVIVSACKPVFFTGEVPFRAIDKVTNRDMEIVPVGELRHGTMYSNGNWRELETYFRTWEDPLRELRVIYFGDHLYSDVLATAEHTTWIPAAILEELDSYVEGEVDSLKYTKKKSNTWGSFFFTRKESMITLLDEDEPKERFVSYWSNYICSYSKCALAVACLSDLVNADINTVYENDGTKEDGCYHIRMNK